MRVWNTPLSTGALIASTLIILAWNLSPQPASVHLGSITDSLIWGSPRGGVYVPPSPQRQGDPAQGYQYVVEGDYLKSGIPYDLFILAQGKSKHNFLQREGANKELPYNFNAVKAPNGILVVVPNCLQCHAQVFGDSLIVGLGSTDIDFTVNERTNTQVLKTLLKTFSGKNSAKYEAAEDFIRVTSSLSPNLVTEVKGVNAADRLAALLAAHRDPGTLHWNDSPSLPIPKEVIPTDVPAWWLLKKKNAMFYNGFGRGDFGKFLMASNLLTVTDTAEANEVDRHIPSVLSWLLTLQPPKYPHPIDSALAGTGKRLFESHCAHCHGTYGPSGQYPNLLIPEAVVGTDSLLYISNFQYPQFISWFNQSWFSSGPYPAQLSPFNGYIAPPLDGIWVTAPYFHNGSVPTLEAVLDSKSRPAYWSRWFGSQTKYDYDKVGWQYVVPKKGETPHSRTMYNTKLRGYGNYGHLFGDKLSKGERKALIEYLKTL